MSTNENFKFFYGVGNKRVDESPDDKRSAPPTGTRNTRHPTLI